jgi:hypothetical protein
MALIAVSALVSSLRFALAQPAPPPDPQQPAYTPSELVNASHRSVPERLSRKQDRAFIKRFLMHYGIYRRYPLGRFPALRNAWRAAQP